MSGSGGYYKYRCKNWLEWECPNWVWINNAPCARCLVSFSRRWCRKLTFYRQKGTTGKLPCCIVNFASLRRCLCLSLNMAYCNMCWGKLLRRVMPTVVGLWISHQRRLSRPQHCHPLQATKQPAGTNRAEWQQAGSSNRLEASTVCIKVI